MTGTPGNVNAVAHVLADAVKTGAAGKTTTLIETSWQVGIPLVPPAGVEPHATVSLYLAFIVQQPGLFESNALAEANDPYALNDPPGGCTAYSAVNPDELKSITAVMFPGAVLHVFAISVKRGAAGKITTLTELPEIQSPVPAIPAEVDPHEFANTYLARTL